MTENMPDLKKPPVLIEWEKSEPDPDTRRIPLSTKWGYEGFTVRAEALLDLENGWVEINRLEIDGPITAGTLQQVKIGTLRERIVWWVQSNPGLVSDVHQLAQTISLVDELGADVIEFRELTPEAKAKIRASAAEVRRLVDVMKGMPPPSRSPGSENPDHYRQVAELYLKMLKEHGPRGVIKGMAEKLDANPNTVSQWVRKARTKGWLKKAPQPGQAGGGPGEELKKWRKEHE